MSTPVTLQLKIAVFVLSFSTAGVWINAGVSFAAAPGWSLTAAPAVAAPAAPGSKQPADPKDYPEVKMDFPITSGPFEPTWDSIRQNHPGAPEWFRDAKFGVFVHWGPQAFGKSGDWYARNLYRQGHPAYNNHIENFGHPSEFGYKDVLNAWKAPKWDAAAPPESVSEYILRIGKERTVGFERLIRCGMRSGL